MKSFKNFGLRTLK